MKLTKALAEQIASLMDEASTNLSLVDDTDIAKKHEFRHWLPDELSGAAIMLREHFSSDES